MVHHLAMELINKGHHASVLAPVPPPSSSYPYQVHPIEDLSPLVSRIENKQEWGKRLLFKNLTREKKRFDFEILHAHFAYPYGYVAGLWGKKHRIATVLTCHGIDVMHLPQWRFGIRPKETELLSKAFQAVDRVVTVSENLEKEVLRLSCPAQKLSTIPNGVDICEEAEHQTASDSPIILAMGRTEPVKGFDLLLEVFATIAARRKGVQLYLVGQGTDLPRLLEISLRLGLRDRVIFKKIVAGEKKKRLLDKSALVICPSRWEGMPLVVLEAMAAGKVVVAFDVGGIGEIIQNNRNGVLIPPFDTKFMVEKVIELLDNPAEREPLEAEARQTALKYTWSRVADQYLELYKNIFIK